VSEPGGERPGPERHGRPERYTSVPRPVLWLIPEGERITAGERHTIEPFYVSTLPVTNAQLEACMPEWERSPLAPGDDDPAVGTSAELAREYCRWYAALARKPIRLPTEAEWEHACRGGSTARRFWGEDETAADAHAWHAGNSGPLVPPLAGKRTNPFGLHAMLGGVWEWVEGDDGGVLRGASWRMPLAEIDCAARRVPAAGETIADAGFRIARSLRG
jgi:formylglycine-generating enzyme required for sulfatase activity